MPGVFAALATPWTRCRSPIQVADIGAWPATAGDRNLWSSHARDIPLEEKGLATAVVLNPAPPGYDIDLDLRLLYEFVGSFRD